MILRFINVYLFEMIGDHGRNRTADLQFRKRFHARLASITISSPNKPQQALAESVIYSNVIQFIRGFSNCLGKRRGNISQH